MDAPAGLGERGAAMWSELTAGRTYDVAWGVLAAEACRAADRLEKLDRLLRRDIDAWAAIEVPESDKPLVLVFDDALGEARQQATALKGLLTTLKLGTSSVVVEPVEKEASALDDLASRRASRRSAASA